MRTTNSWRPLLAAMFAAFPLAAAAATYHIAPAGDDRNAGTAAQPLRSIQRCAVLARPGDHCLIHPGSYRELVRPARSGTAAAPIRYRPAIAGTVRIDGRDPVAEWTLVSPADLEALSAGDPQLAQSPFAQAVRAGLVYKASVAPAPAIAESQVFSGDAMLPQAQFPDPGFDPLEPVVQLAGAGSKPFHIADPALDQPAGYWRKAHAYVQTQWIALTGIVEDSMPGAITLDRSHSEDPGHWKMSCFNIAPEFTRYYLYGKLSELNAPGEWLHDRASQTPSPRPVDGLRPADGAITIKQRDLAFDLDGRSHIHVSGLGLFGATIRTGDSSRGIRLSSLDVRFPSHFVDFRPDRQVASADPGGCGSLAGGIRDSGIVLRGRGNSLRDSRIADSAGNGVALLGSHNSVINNLIHDVDYSGGWAAGIEMAGHHHRVMHNTIYSSGRSAIQLHSGLQGPAMHGNRIAFNDLYRYGRLQQDSGALYACCAIDFRGGSIDHNRVHDAQGMARVPFAAEIGIYIDGGSSNFLIHNNAGWNNYHATVGLVAHSGIDNRVYNNSGNVFVYKLDPATGTQIRNNIGTLLVERSDPGITAFNNLPAEIDPLYVDAGAGDFRLQAASPARNAATPIRGVTEGASDRLPSLGALQYGAAPWQAGASFAPALPLIRRYGASSLLQADAAWAQPRGALGQRSAEHGFAYLPPRDQAVQGHLRLGFSYPVIPEQSIDRVELRLYARMHRDSPGNSAKLLLSVDGLGKAWDAGGVDFDSSSRAITIDLSQAVAGDRTRLPRWIDLEGGLGPAPFRGPVSGFLSTAIWIFAAEIDVQAH